MDDLNKRLIEAAVRPLSWNAELQLTASQLLGDLIRPDAAGAEQAIARWERVDRKARRFTWRIALLVILLLASSVFLVFAIIEARNIRASYNVIASMGGGPVVPGSTWVPKPEKKTLTPDQRLILYGDEAQATKTGKSRGLWDKHPSNPAYFSQYAESHLSENGTLPSDFLNQARKIAPQNAWFYYLSAAEEAKDCVKKKTQSATAKAANEAPEWEIIDAEKLNAALGLIHEARDLEYCDDYKSELMREKVPLLEQGNQLERFAAIAYFAGMTASDLISMRNLGSALAAKAQLLGKEKNHPEFRALMADTDAFSHKILSMEPSTLVAGLVCRADITTVSQGLAVGARDLGLLQEADHFQKVSDDLHQFRLANKKRDLKVDGVEFGLKSAFLPALTVPMVSRQVANPPEIKDEDLKPGRLVEHEIVSIVCASAVFLLMGVTLAGVWISSGFRKPIMRLLARRTVSLLGPVDWFLLFGLGIIVPVVFVMTVNRMTPLGGRDLSVFGTKFVLPTGHFFALFLLMVISPIAVARWRISKKAAFLGFSWGNPWIGGIAAAFAAAYVIGIGFVAPSVSTSAEWMVALLLVFPKLWILFIAGRALLAKSYHVMACDAVSNVLVPAYAAGMLILIAMMPFFKASERSWFERDTFMAVDPKCPGMGTYEYKVAAQLQKELREALGYEP